MWLTVSLALAAIAPAGCAHARKVYELATNEITESAQRYNDALRWGNVDQAAAYVEPMRRSQYVQNAQSASKDVRITDVKLGPVDFPPNSERATVTVTRSFYRVDQLTEKSETIVEQWYRKNGHWYIDLDAPH